MSKENWFSVVQELRVDNSQKQKNGLHFIITSIFIWATIFIIHMTHMPILTKNLFTFCCSAPLFPLAYLISKILKIEFQNKDNPLTTLGILFAVNQMLYILIAMWVYASVPDKMVMVYAMIFGAHLLPYGWLYQSKAYFSFAILIPILVLAIGIHYPASTVAGTMFFFEIALSICLAIEVNRDLKTNKLCDIL